MKNTPPLDSPAQKANIGSYSEYGLTALPGVPRGYNSRVVVKGGVNLDHFGGAKVDQLVKG